MTYDKKQLKMLAWLTKNLSCKENPKVYFYRSLKSRHFEVLFNKLVTCTCDQGGSSLSASKGIKEGAVGAGGPHDVVAFL